MDPDTIADIIANDLSNEDLGWHGLVFGEIVKGGFTIHEPVFRPDENGDDELVDTRVFVVKITEATKNVFA